MIILTKMVMTVSMKMLKSTTWQQAFHCVTQYDGVEDDHGPNAATDNGCDACGADDGNDTDAATDDGDGGNDGGADE